MKTLYSKNRNSGSAILAMLIMVLLLSAISGTYLRVALDEYKMAQRTARLQGAMNVAEAGAEEAIYSLLYGNWSNWSEPYSDQYFKKFQLTSYFANQGYGKVYLNNTDPANPVLLVQGSITGPFGDATKQVRIDLASRGLFANGLTARRGVTFNGNNVSVDSYNSNNGPWDPLLNRNDKGTVGSLAVTVGAVSIQNADVFGFVATGGGAPTVGSNGSVKGKNTPPGVKVDSSRVTTDFSASFDSVPAPDMSGASSSISGVNVGSPGAGSPEKYKLTSLSLKNNEKIRVRGPVIIEVTGDIDIKGEIEITATGSLELYTHADVNVGGNGIANQNQPEKLAIFGMNPTEGDQTIKLHGNGALNAAVYAPFANLDLKGGGNSGVFNGAAVANFITMNGNYEFHYDEALSDYNKEREFRINKWRELIDQDEKLNFQSMSALSNASSKKNPINMIYSLLP